jgi:hypothetical protein
MIAKYNGIVYKDNELQLFSTGAIFVKPLKRAFWNYEFEFVKYDGAIDLNDTVSVILTKWGATYLNARNMYKNETDTGTLIYKTDYKEGDVYKEQLWKLILDFKDGFRFDKEKVFKQLIKIC